MVLICKKQYFKNKQLVILIILYFISIIRVSLSEKVRICIPYTDGVTNSTINECTSAFSLINTIDVDFECVTGGSTTDCIEKINKDEAELTTLDGSDIILNNLNPLVIEKNAENIAGGEYYAVAVVTKEFCDNLIDNDDNTLLALKSKNSCHTGYRKTSGWVIPVGTLAAEVPEFNINTEELKIEDDAELIAAYFNDVCAPRTSGNGPQNTDDESGELWDPLCTGCKGDCSTNDQYYDYSGALRCMMEGSGDVAFVKHSTALDYAIDGNLNDTYKAWSTLEKSEMRLICRDGGCSDVDDFENCHLGLAPAHALVSGERLSLNGDRKELGLAIQEAFENIKDLDGFLKKTIGLINNFPWTSSTVGFEIIENGIDDYVSEETKASFEAFNKIKNYEVVTDFDTINFDAIYCAASEEEGEFCKKMIEELSKSNPDINWGCHQELSHESCFNAIMDDKSQWTTVEAIYAHEANKDFGLEVGMTEVTSSGIGINYYAVAVVKSETCTDNINLSELKGKSSCHTGYRKNTGWKMPVGTMVNKAIMPIIDESIDIQNDAESVANYFNDICAPGIYQGGPISITETGLEAWDDLCTICNSTCDESDKYYSYEGSYLCLAEGAGDVAFVKHETLFKYEKAENIENYKLICNDRSGCHDVDDYIHCNLGTVPAKGTIVNPNNKDKDSLINALIKAVNEDEVILNYFSSPSTNPEGYVFSSYMNSLSIVKSTDEYLGLTKDIYDSLDDLDENNPLKVKMCVPYESYDEMFLDECTKVMSALNNEVFEIECVNGGSSDACIEMVGKGEALLTTLDGGDALKANELYDITPLLREVSDSGEVIGGTYYSVAVVHKDFCTSDTTLGDLYQKSACHTGYRKTAGWVIPVGTLAAEVPEFNINATESNIEDDAELIAAYFNDVCAPRTSGNGPQNTDDESGALWDPLCTGCKGDCSTNDQYYDYSGALRCMMEGSGDVAFVKHSTALDYAIDGNLNDTYKAWSTLEKSEMRLICRDGGCSDVDDFENCNLALVPSHAIVAPGYLSKGGSNSKLGEEIQDAFLVAAADKDNEFMKEAAGLLNSFPFSSSTTNFVPVYSFDEYITIDAIDTIDAFYEINDQSALPGVEIEMTSRYCASSLTELEFCSQLSLILSDIIPYIEWNCKYDPYQNCNEMLAEGKAEWTSLKTSEDLYHAYNDYGLEAVVENSDDVNYAIAIVSEDTCQDTSISILDFKNEVACFPSYQDDAGWNLPVSYLISNGYYELIYKDNKIPNQIESTDNFFGDICAPIVNNYEDLTVSSLCNACQSTCDENDDFFGDTGTLKCLSENPNGISFTTSRVLSTIGDDESIRLMCPKEDGCKSITNYTLCNFGIAASFKDVIIISDALSADDKNKFASALVTAAGNEAFSNYVFSDLTNPNNYIFSGNENNIRAVVVRTDELLNESQKALNILDHIEENPNTYKNDIKISTYVESKSGNDDRPIESSGDALIMDYISHFTCFYISLILFFFLI